MISYHSEKKMYRFRISLLLTVLLLVCFGCHAQVPSFHEDRTTVIAKEVDLKGGVLRLPKNVTLKFIKGGCFKNGTIVADNTSIKGYKQNVFDSITIAGQWNVEYICTDMFKDLSQVNSLKNVFALTSKTVNNVVIIEDGTYTVSAEKIHMSILKVSSNTEVILNGTIVLTPNNLPSCNIIELNGQDIMFHGHGEIVGDKHAHLGTDGEWGMGIILRGCSNVDIYDLTIKDCWGDCIYVGAKSTNVRINNCTLDHGRRQGISITSAGNVLIENCIISNVGGTDPEYAIDVEPNQNDVIESVVINNVKAINCKGGFLTWSGAKNSKVEKVKISDCYVQGASKDDYAFYFANEIKVENCTSDRKSKPRNNKCKSFEIIE